jgi:hypothetical protein
MRVNEWECLFLSFYRNWYTVIDNGAELRLNISYKELETDEVKDDDKGMLESITKSVKDKTKSLKEKLD